MESGGFCISMAKCSWAKVDNMSTTSNLWDVIENGPIARSASCKIVKSNDKEGVLGKSVEK